MLKNKRILSKRKNDKMFYPTKIKVDEVYNPFTGKNQDVLISTGPYRKDICGTTLEGVRKYLAYIVDKYNEDKKAYQKKQAAKFNKTNEDSK